MPIPHYSLLLLWKDSRNGNGDGEAGANFTNTFLWWKGTANLLSHLKAFSLGWVLGPFWGVESLEVSTEDEGFSGVSWLLNSRLQTVSDRNHRVPL